MKIVVWQTAFLGDLILTTPLIASLKNIYKESKIYLISKPFGKDVFKNNPYLDKLIIFDKNKQSTLNLIKTLYKEKFDIAISPHRSHRASYSLFLARIPKRIGFDKAGFSFLYTDKAIHRFDGTHEIIRNLSLLKFLPEYDETKIIDIPQIFLDEEEEKYFTKFKLVEKDYIVIAPGSKWATKRWTAKGFAEVIDILSYEGQNIVLIGSKEDEEFTEEILKKVKRNVINLVGKTTLRETFSIIKNAKLLISNDSAPVHMAVAFNTPVIDIYGPTITDFGFYPYRNGVVVEIKDLPCRPCGLHGSDKCPISTHECMEKLTPSMVIEKISSHFQNIF